MALLGFFPLFYAHGVDARVWMEVRAAWLAFDEVWGGTVGCVVGAWVGAVPIPLDWWVLSFLGLGLGGWCLAHQGRGQRGSDQREGYVNRGAVLTGQWGIGTANGRNGPSPSSRAPIWAMCLADWWEATW